MSNRDVQPIQFSCQSCGSLVDLLVHDKGPGHVKGGVLLREKREFDEDTNFVDLHLDFPVSFEKYVMGHTPFMMAVKKIGHRNYQFHDHRLNALNELYPLAEDLRRITRLYSRNVDLFLRLCKSRFGEESQTRDPQDINATLYRVIAKVFFPFSLPADNAQSVHNFTELIHSVRTQNKEAMDAFVTEIIETGFLKSIQSDSLSIYPRVLEAELPLRPALFLDFLDDPDKELVALRVSAGDFAKQRDLFKDISETISRQMVLVAGLNNLIHRQDHDDFLGAGKLTPTNLAAFADIPFGSKFGYLDDCWYTFGEGATDNQLRNSVAHYKMSYDEVTQLITYFPRKEGLKQERPETMYFLDFMRKILIAYREMHSLHHLIKCIYYYYFFVYKK